MKKLYAVSSTTFDSLEEAEELLQSWFDNGNLHDDAKVYEVKKTFKPKIRLEEE